MIRQNTSAGITPNYNFLNYSRFPFSTNMLEIYDIVRTVDQNSFVA
ncbi:hypothetical protein SAMN05192585_13244 [Acetanaerobacterium elongatum]|uniref:Uncharacterized protein n=1 Tax=Acetanaerobacterium elongatum TaxID=258515 RepID=A0A1H0EC31_9FIRM|nr:hypothetical protein SAMN05192585_13244 [Acetanaerobacterium elongatum]